MPIVMTMVTDIRTAAPPDGRTLLSDLVALPALRGARVAPAAARMDRPVSCLAIADAGAPEEIDALLVCSGAPPADLPPGCVGVVCRTTPSVDPGVPAIVLPPAAPWGAVIAALAAAIAGGSGQAGAARARAMLRAPLVEGQGFPGLAAAAAELLGAPVAILDDYLDLRGASALSPEQDEFLAAAVTRARGHGPASVVGPFVEEAMPGITREVVHGSGGVIGVLVAWVPPPLTASRQGVLAELAEASSLERAREEVRTETESRLRGDLIEELMAGEIVSRESLVRRARHLGADLSGGAVALIG